MGRGEQRRKERALNDLERKKMALVESITKNGDRLMGFIVSIMNNRQDAEEVYQEFWIKAFKEWSSELIGETNFLFWKACFMAYDYRDKVSRRREHALIEEIFGSPAQAVSQDAYTRSEEIALKEKFWSEYPGIEIAEEKKEVLWLHARYGFTYGEIEKITGIARSTTGDWIADARRALKDFINQENQTH